MIQSLLLHGTLSIDMLAEMLPFSISYTRQILSLLEEGGTALESDGIWRISAPAYPAARQLLQDEGYLTDDF